MRSPFSARSFADRAAARGTTPDRARKNCETVEDRDAAAAEMPGGQADGHATRRETPAAEAGAAPRPATRAPAPKPETGTRTTGARVAGRDGTLPRLVVATTRAPARMAGPGLDIGSPTLLPIQALAKDGRWRVEALHSYRAPVLYWFTRGQGRLTLSGATRGYGAHNAVFVPAQCMHAFELNPQIFGSAVFFAGLDDLALPEGPLHLRVRDAAVQTEVTALLESLSREIDGDRAHRDRAIRLHAGLLAIWLDRHRDLAAPQAASTAAQRLASRFAEAVEAGLYTGQGVADYAESLGVTATHLSRVCRESCGRTASDILAERTMVEARRLLAETGLPVKQVAEMLGFGSAAYFTRAFQSRIGQTPTQFRRVA